MKALLARHELKFRFVVAGFAGLLLAAAYPKPGVAGLAWIVPGLLLFTAQGQPPRRSFQLGFGGGLVFNLVALHWLLFIPVTFLPILGWLALSAYCAVFPGLWLWLGWRLLPGEFTSHRPGRQAMWMFQCALLWAGLEFVLGRFLTGFPWLPLGLTQYKLWPVTQAAALTGITGVSFLLVWFAVAFAGGLWVLARDPGNRLRFARSLALPFGVVLAANFPGLIRPELSPAQLAGSTLKLALVQPSIPQHVIWDPAERTNRFAKLMELSALALATRPDVLVWPEAALPEFTETSFRAVTNLVIQHRVWMIFGADDHELKPGAPAGSERVEDYNFYNAAFLVSPDGALAGVYRKRRLVIFGEYVPLARWLPFLKWFTPIQGGFTPGTGPVHFTLPLPGTNAPATVKAGMLICFEDVFPDITRAHARDADFLLNLTNDGWFGEGAAHWQQAANATFRAVENRRPLVRCTNNGLTCWIDQSGRLQLLGSGDAAEVYGPGFRVLELPVGRRGGGPLPQTVYQRWGDWFGWTAVAASGFLGWRALRRRPAVDPAAPAGA